VLFCVIFVICVLCLIVVPLPPGRNPFEFKSIIIIIIIIKSNLVCVSSIDNVANNDLLNFTISNSPESVIARSNSVNSKFRVYEKSREIALFS
jgi:hypothetical protein